MAEEVKKEITEVKAFARGVHISPRKVRLVANLVKSLPVYEAIVQLEFMTKRSANPIKKLIDSAIANAEHNFQVEPDRLFVKNLTVDGGQVFMRYEPRAQGRAFPVRKRTSHLNLILGVAKQAFKSRKKIVPIQKPAQDEVAKEVSPVSDKPVESKSSRFAFWKKKKAQDSTQVAPKEDVKGKHYTGFDRRGNMP